MAFWLTFSTILQQLLNGSCTSCRFHAAGGPNLHDEQLSAIVGNTTAHFAVATSHAFFAVPPHGHTSV